MGFLSDLFGLKTKYVDEELDEAELAAQIEKAKAFFLAPDEAKTLGKNGYRLTPIKNKVPTTQGSKENIEQIQQTSNLNLIPEPQAADQSTQTSSDHTSARSSMDMFRQMARNIKKY